MRTKLRADQREARRQGNTGARKKHYHSELRFKCRWVLVEILAFWPNHFAKVFAGETGACTDEVAFDAVPLGTATRERSKEYAF